jgi:hypothetical protein
MKRISIPGLGLARGLSLAAAAMLMLSVAASERADAMSPIGPGPPPVSQRASDALMIPVRGGHGGHGGHGGGGGHWHGGGGHWHGGGGWHGGWHRGGWHGGFHRFHHRRFYGGYYPYYSSSYYPRRCRVVWTHWGPRRVCYHRHWHRRYWY